MTERVMEATWRDRYRVGSCCFCARDGYVKVLVVRRPGGVEIRFCRTCAREVKAAIDRGTFQ